MWGVEFEKQSICESSGSCQEAFVTGICESPEKRLREAQEK